MTMTEKCTDMRYPDSQSDGVMSNQFFLVTPLRAVTADAWVESERTTDSSDGANYPARP